MAEKLFALDFPPGLVNNGTTFQSRGRWYSGNCVRFFEGRIQPIGGWVARPLEFGSIAGTPRCMISYRLPAGASEAGLGITSDSPLFAIGTTRGLYFVDQNVVFAGDHLSPHDITPAAIASEDATAWWVIEQFGSYIIAVRSGTTPYLWRHGVSGPTAESSPTWGFGADGPTTARAVVVTPERFLVFLGATDRRRVKWASQETISDWVASDTNTAGDFDLETSGSLVCGKASRGQTLLWTTVDFWTMTYDGGEFVFSFAKAGDNCGIVSALAAVVMDGAGYWMSFGKFFAFDGYVRPLACDVADYVFGSINLTYAYKIWALPNPRFGEVTWFYPSADATEIDRYVTYNYQEHHWSFGTLVRTAGVAQQAGATTPVPVLMGSDATIYNHETGNARTGQTVSLESGPMQQGDGDNVVRIQRVIPDDDTEGDVSASLYTSLYPNAAETLNGPYTLTSPTSVRLTARQVRLRLTEVTASAWRVGVVRLGGILGGRR